MADGRGANADRELELARDALNDGRVLLDGDGTDAGVLNRLYYATFHGAQAVLYARGKNPTSHGHVRQQFGQHVVLAGDASREMGRLLGKLYDYRWEADYGGDPPTVDLDALYTEARTFVSRMAALLEANDAND